MPDVSLSRRAMLFRSAAVGAGAAAVLNPAAAQVAAARAQEQAGPFRYCLNTSTIRGKALPLPQVVDIAAKAGYDGIEPWLREIETYRAGGGSLPDLKKRIADHGLRVESAIGFARWIVDNEAERKAGLQQAKQDMQLVRAIGGTRIAAPPAGAHQDPELDLDAAAERYRALLELGSREGVIPQLEFWGSARSLYRLSQAAYIAVQAGHRDACLLPDIYHMFRGGSDFRGLNMIAGSAIHCFHVNDYPASPARTEQNDGHRVYPGDGVAPMKQIFTALKQNGFSGVLSLELFNADYWQQDPLAVATTGLEKTKATVAAALSS